MVPLPRIVAAAILLVACDHSAPFPRLTFPEGLLPGAPTRMTYDLGDDLLFGHGGPAGEVAYQRCRERRPHEGDACTAADRCVGFLPAGGGPANQLLCGSTYTSPDSIRVVGAAARGDDGSMLWSYAARHWTASFSVTPGLYARIPGDLTPRLVMRIESTSGPPLLPDRIWWLGDATFLVRTGGGGGLRVTLTRDAAPEIVPVTGPIEGVDPPLRRLFRVTSDGVGWRPLDGGEETLVTFPAPEEWDSPRIVAASAWDGTWGVIQSGLLTPGVPSSVVSRLLVFREGGPEREMAFDIGEPWFAVSVEPGGRSVVAQRYTFGEAVFRHMDLYRYEGQE